jgi:hypothetical protein
MIISPAVRLGFRTKQELYDPEVLFYTILINYCTVNISGIQAAALDARSNSSRPSTMFSSSAGTTDRHPSRQVTIYYHDG